MQVEEGSAHLSLQMNSQEKGQGLQLTGGSCLPRPCGEEHGGGVRGGGGLCPQAFIPSQLVH